MLLLFTPLPILYIPVQAFSSCPVSHWSSRSSPAEHTIALFSLLPYNYCNYRSLEQAAFPRSPSCFKEMLCSCRHSAKTPPMFSSSAPFIISSRSEVTAAAEPGLNTPLHSCPSSNLHCMLVRRLRRCSSSGLLDLRR